MIALIPMRKESVRCRDKNTRLLGGIPLYHWIVEAAKISNRFDEIFIVSDFKPNYLLGCSWVKDETETGKGDINWIKQCFDMGLLGETFAILRPTNPFIKPYTIRYAVDHFLNPINFSYFDSLRSIAKVTEHPGKMWTVEGHLITPYDRPEEKRFTKPTQSLESVWKQTSGIEIIWTETLINYNNVAGEKIGYVVLYGNEGFDINTEEDFLLAESLIDRGLI